MLQSLASRGVNDIMIGGAEMAERLLATLEEAGNERANPLLNTIINPTGNPDEVLLFQQTLKDLLTENLVVIRMTSIPHGRQALTDEDAMAQIAILANHYNFDPTEGIWSDTRYGGPPYYQIPEPEVVLTKSGREKSVQLLQERGYEWWRQRR